ncbi:helix-turn-helix domain-containing protein [Kallipyga gabonensis]|uniref:helix-turn-helix domain-containing protein n=1 Tax=Kallipyga gabonensis TaxID=1686287 RepID=UPI0006B62646|nr:helix-turn-helix domain-containing protein [Kallipyga gabonensis]
MHNLLNDIVDRRLRLVEALTYSEETQSPVSLAQIMGISHRTLANDIDQINEEWQRVSIRSDEDRLAIHYRPGSNITDVYRDIMNKEPLFALIRALILHPNLSRSDLAREAAMSEASLYRNVLVFNQSLLADLGLSISTNPFRLEGGGHEECLLFSSIFLCKQTDVETWPFPDYPQEAVQAFVQVMLDASRMKMGLSEFRMVTYYVVLSIIWAKSTPDPNAFLQDWHEKVKARNSHKRDAIDALGNLPHFLQSVEKYQAVFDFPMTLPALIYLYSIYFRREYFTSYQGLLNTALVDPEINRSFFSVSKILDDIEDQYGIKPDDRHEMIRDLHNTLFARYIEPDMVPFFFRISRSYSQPFIRPFPQLYANIRSLLEDYFITMGLPCNKIVVECSFFSLLMKWGKLLYRTPPREKRLSLLIITSLGHAHALFLRNQAREAGFFPLTISLFDRQTFRWAEILQEGYDVIWTNLSPPESLLPDPDHPFRFQGVSSRIVLFNITPIAKDLDLLRSAIHDCIRDQEEDSL